MEGLYSSVEYNESEDSCRLSTPHTGPSSSESRSHGAAVVSLGLLSVFLLAGLVGLGVHHHNSAADLSSMKDNLTERLRAAEDKLTSVSEERDLLNSSLTQLTGEMDRLQRWSKLNHDSARGSAADLSTMKDNLTERLRAAEDKLTSVSEERDLLNSSLTQLTGEMDRLQRWSKPNKTCPAGWKTLSSSCYFLSSRSDSWEQSREDCRDKGADLVVIDSLEEQKFLSSIVQQRTWIGLHDGDDEGSWKWIDGTPLTQAYWNGQPDNGGGHPQYGEEDCVEIIASWYAEENWNDVRCDNSKRWICENLAQG